MRPFDKVIGYAEIKNELMQVVDIIHNRELYDEIGATLPHGILLIGDPGMGKSLISQCFIEECGVNSFTVRRSQSDEELLESIKKAFNHAAECAPSIVFLDDMDKFANEDSSHCDAKEYVTIQTCIDEVKGKDVFVIATVNDDDKLPDSLTRKGRFDKVIRVYVPQRDDAHAIVAHYLSKKKISDKLDINDVSKMVTYNSCAELETLLNEAAINAVYDRRTEIIMDDIVRVVLKNEYCAADFSKKEASEDEMREVALHEAGHAVISELVNPGCIGLVSIIVDSDGDTRGVTRRWKRLSNLSHRVLSSLAGKAAVEMILSDRVASGCQNDIERATGLIREGIRESGNYGLYMVDTGIMRSEESENHKSNCSSLISSELERYYRLAKEILYKNKDFLLKVADELFEKKTILYSDMQRIKEELGVVKLED